VAIVMEGYERTLIRKELDNDDPFPDLDKVRVTSEWSDSKSDMSDSETKSVDFKMETGKKPSEGPGLSRFARMASGHVTEPPQISHDSEAERDDHDENQIFMRVEEFDRTEKSFFRRSASYEELNEEKSAKQDCINKLKMMAQKVKDKMLEMKQIASECSEIAGPGKEFIDDLFEQYQEDICSRINFLTNVPFR